MHCKIIAHDFNKLMYHQEIITDIGSVKADWDIWNSTLYYVDKGVLVEYRPLVQFIRNYIRDSSGVFSISLLVRTSMTSFPALLLFLCKNTPVNIIKRKSHGGLKI